MSAKFAKLGVEGLTERIVPAGVTFHWTGNGLTNDASNAANYDLNQVPGNGDIVILDGQQGPNSNKGITFDPNFLAQLATLQVQSTYGGALVVEHDMTVDSLIMGTATLTIDTDITLNVNQAMFSSTPGAATPTVNGNAGSELHITGNNNPMLGIGGTTNFGMDSLVIDSNATWGIGANLTFTTTTDVTQNGVVNWVNGAISDLAGIIFQNNGTFNVLGTNSFQGAGVIYNNNVFRKIGGAGTVLLEQFVNRSPGIGVTVGTGTLELRAISESQSTTWQVDNGATLLITRNHTVSGTVSLIGTGQLVVASATGLVTINAGATLISNVTLFQINDAQAQVRGPQGVAGGTFQVNGALDWPLGTISGLTEVEVNGSLQMNGTGRTLYGTKLYANGPTTWASGTLTLDNQAEFHNRGVFSIQTDSDLVYGMTNGGTFYNEVNGTNRGQVTKTQGTSTIFYVSFQNSADFLFNGKKLQFERGLQQSGTGTINLGGGTMQLEVGSNFTMSGGTLLGNGSILDGNVTVSGGSVIVGPGQTLTIRGNFTTQDSGALVIQAFDNAWGKVSVVNRRATLGGTLTVSLRRLQPAFGLHQGDFDGRQRRDGADV